MISDKITRGIDPKNGKEIEKVEYLVEENGEKRVYSTKLKDDKGQLSYFVQQMSEFNEGETVIMEMKKNGAKNYISVDRLTSAGDVEVDDDMDYDGPDPEPDPEPTIERS